MYSYMDSEILHKKKLLAVSFETLNVPSKEVGFFLVEKLAMFSLFET